MTEDPVARAAIADIARRAGLNEAVGLLWRAPGEAEQVLELSNISNEPQSSYVIRTGDLIKAVSMVSGLPRHQVAEIDPAHFVVWHTHPSGAKGPSLKDMRSKLPSLRYAVVVLTDGEITDIVEY